ncbi:hypothetical protein ACOV11_25470 [Vibrio natriegens]
MRPRSRVIASGVMVTLAAGAFAGVVLVAIVATAGLSAAVSVVVIA